MYLFLWLETFSLILLSEHYLLLLSRDLFYVCVYVCVRVTHTLVHFIQYLKQLFQQSFELYYLPVLENTVSLAYPQRVCSGTHLLETNTASLDLRLAFAGSTLWDEVGSMVEKLTLWKAAV